MAALRLVHALYCSASHMCAVSLGRAGQDLLAIQTSRRWVLGLAEPLRRVRLAVQVLACLHKPAGGSAGLSNKEALGAAVGVC